jgi:hypothetical protein
MMADTILLAFLILGFIIFLLYALVKGNKLSRNRVILSSGIFLTAIISVFFYAGFKKINSDISRIIHNSSPRSPIEIYTLLFKKPLDSCVAVVNIKDQQIPVIDCCIWMEVKLCPAELIRIVNSKKYEKSVYSRSDSLSFLQNYSGRPTWWSPQNLGDSLVKLNIKFDQENQQSIFFGSESSHIYICDQAL